MFKKNIFITHRRQRNLIFNIILILLFRIPSTNLIGNNKGLAVFFSIYVHCVETTEKHFLIWADIPCGVIHCNRCYRNRKKRRSGSILSHDSYLCRLGLEAG